MAADELSGGVDDHVGAVLDGAQQVRRGEGGVHDQRHVVAVRDVCPGLKVEHVGVGVAQRLGVQQLGVVLDGGLDGVQVGRVDERGGKSLLGQRVLEQVQRSAVQVGGGHDVVAGGGDVLHGDGDGGGTGRHAQGTHAALECGNAFLEGADRGVGQAAVDVAGLGQAETAGGGGGILEHIGRGQVDRHGAGIGCRIGLLLAGVHLQGFECVLLLLRHLVISSIDYYGFLVLI